MCWKLLLADVLACIDVAAALRPIHRRTVNALIQRLVRLYVPALIRDWVDVAMR